MRAIVDYFIENLRSPGFRASSPRSAFRRRSRRFRERTADGLLFVW